MKKLITSFFIFFFILAKPALAGIIPNDPYYRNQWYLAKINANNAWEKISESPDIVIAVIDSGIDINHPDLKNNIWRNSREIPGNNKDDDNNGFADDVHGWDFVLNTPDPSPKFSSGWTEAGVSHGTMVAGIIAAQGNNHEGIAGVVWKTKIMPLKVLNDKGEGKISDVIRAIDYATNNGASIINLSFVNFNYSEAMQEAIARAHRAGVIIVAAAGNEQATGEGYDIDKTPIYPACYDGNFGENMVIGVAATDALDQKASFSSYGSRCVDITAPGISFFGTVTPGSDRFDQNKYYDGFWSGTSLAAPLVSASLALIAQANPELNRREIVNILFASTENISRLNPNYAGRLGNGRLNLDRAIELAKENLYSKLGRLIIFPVSGNQEVKLTAVNGDLVKSPFSQNNKIKANSSIAIGDVNGDNFDEIVVGAPAGDEPYISVFDAEGKLLKKFLAYEKNFRGGVKIALANFDNNEQLEIVSVPASRSTAQVRIFDYNGKIQSQFLAVDKRIAGSWSIAAGNVEGKGENKIVLAFGEGQEPQIRIFDKNGKLISVFLAYEKKFRGGVNVAVANIDGRGNRDQAEIITVPAKGREAEVKIFNNFGQLKNKFTAYGKNWLGGANLSTGDVNNDGINEIALGANPGGAPHIRIFDNQGVLQESFYAWEADWSGGINLGIIKLSN
ncbi:S8 family serine peptidase [Candidatus Falkowbacteria bacterium]|jgi:subtilisin family serine protease|nr:S8 family serine peptidase [Candidatus Falkowbacteria bacterium]